MGGDDISLYVSVVVKDRWDDVSLYVSVVVDGRDDVSLTCLEYGTDSSLYMSVVVVDGRG